MIDFGIAKIAARRMAETQEGMNKGKLTYMSPEQLSAAKSIDRRADIWTAGVVLYEALTGTHPFRGSSAGSTISNILRRDPELPSTVGLCPPPHFDHVCVRALRRQRSERFATADEMIEELRSIALEHDLLGDRSEVARWVKKTFDKHVRERDAILQQLEIASPVDEDPLPVFPMSSLSGSWDGSFTSSNDDNSMKQACTEKIGTSDGSDPILTPPPSLLPSPEPSLPPSPSGNRREEPRAPAEKSPLRSGSVIDVSALDVDMERRPPPRPLSPSRPRPRRRYRLSIMCCAALIALVVLLAIWRSGLIP